MKSWVHYWHTVDTDVSQNTEGGDTDSEDEADRLEEVESYLRVYDPDFKTSVALSLLCFVCRICDISFSILTVFFWRRTAACCCFTPAELRLCNTLPTTDDQLLTV